MAAGDLIVKDGQYELLGLLFNSGTEANAIKVTKTQGLFDLPAFKGYETELDDDHGGTVGRQLLTKRRILMELEVMAVGDKGLMMATIDVLNGVFQPRPTINPLVFQRPFIGKRFINVKTNRFSGLDSNWAREMGRASATLELVAPDPRKFSLAQQSQAIVIPSAGTNNSGVVNMAGNFLGGSKPILELAGPWTNPRISNSNDENRSIRIDMVINAGETLILDFAARTITLGGVDHSDKVRTDNQWWVLVPGNNTITATRSNTPANTATLTVKWWDAFA